MAKSNQAIPEIRWRAVLGDLLTKGAAPSSPVTSPNNQDVTDLFDSVMDVIFAGLSKKRSDVPSVLPVSNYRDGIFTPLSTKNTVNPKPAFLPVTHCQDGMLADLWTESRDSKPTVLSEVHPRATMTKNNQTDPELRWQPDWDGIFAEFSKKSTALFRVPGKPTVLPDPDHPDSKVSGQTIFSYPIVTHAHGHRTSIPISYTMLVHHVQRAIKENEDNVPLENFSEDDYLYHLVREVVKLVINSKRTGSFSSVPLFLRKATVPSDLDHRDKKGHKATPIDPADSKEPDQEIDPADSKGSDQEIDSYRKVSLIEPSSEQPDGGGICKNFAVEDYPHPKNQNSACYLDFNEDHYLYPAVLASVNLALEDYNKQSELIYELVEIVKLSATGLGGLLYHITFKAMSPEKELTTFEAEVFDRISKKEVLRVGIRKPGSDWFDGKLYRRNSRQW